MTIYSVLIEGEKYFPNSPFINDEAFVNAIKGSSLAECNDKKNNYNTDNSQTENIYKSTTINDDYSSTTDDGTSNVNFNHFETASTQQDTQSIKSNEIDGSLNDTEFVPRKGIIDILYTNENYTDATKSKDLNEQTNVKLVGNNSGIENVGR